MLRRRRSGELDVFGATRYFDDDLATGPYVAVRELQDLKIQVKVACDVKTEETYQCDSQSQLGARSKSSLAAFFGSMVSLEASFRKKEETASSPMPSHDDPPKVSSSSSRGRFDVGPAAASLQGRRSHDFGAAAMGDRRLQGIRVVMGAGGDEEKWVVRCGGWEEEHYHGKIFDAASGVDRQVEGKGDGDGLCWDSDTSTDLFELDLEDRSC